MAKHGTRALLFVGAALILIVGACSYDAGVDPTPLGPSLLWDGTISRWDCITQAALACHGDPTFLWPEGPGGGGGDADGNLEVISCPEDDPNCVTRNLSPAELIKFNLALAHFKTTGVCGQMKTWAQGRLLDGYVKAWDLQFMEEGGGWLAADVHWRGQFGINDTRARLHIWGGTLAGPSSRLAYWIGHEFLHPYNNSQPDLDWESEPANAGETPAIGI